MSLPDSIANLAASLKSSWLICVEELLKSPFKEDVISRFRFKKELHFEKPNIQRIGLTRYSWVQSTWSFDPQGNSLFIHNHFLSNQHPNPIGKKTAYLARYLLTCKTRATLPPNCLFDVNIILRITSHPT